MADVKCVNDLAGMEVLAALNMPFLLDNPLNRRFQRCYLGGAKYCRNCLRYFEEGLS